MSVADFPDWQAPQAHATAIAATGVPLLHAKNVLESVSAVSIPGGSPHTGAVSSVTQVSYRIYVKLTIQNTATTPFAVVQLRWIDGPTAKLLDTDSFVVPCATGIGGFVVYGQGPVKADSVACEIINLDSAAAITASYVTYQTSRVTDRDVWHWDNTVAGSASVPGWVLASLPFDESVLGMLGGVTVPASGQSQYLFGMHNGLIQAALDQGGGPWTNVSVLIAAQPNSSYAINNQVYASVSPPPVFTIAGPRAPLRVILKNTATTAFTATMSLIRAD